MGALRDRSEARSVPFSDDFYIKLGKMTAAFADLDSVTTILMSVLGALVDEPPLPQWKGTSNKAGWIERWAKRHADLLGDQAAGLQSAAQNIQDLMKRRRDAVHGLPIQTTEGVVFHTMQSDYYLRPSDTTDETMVVLTDETNKLITRVGMLIAPVDRMRDSTSGRPRTSRVVQT